MVDVVVKFNSKKAISDTNVYITGATKIIVEELYKLLQANSPVKSGKFRRSWKMSGTKERVKITNPQPYGQRLEDGYSKKAPQGIIKPSINQIIRQEKIRRK
jgi:hypothetical protein